MNKVTSGTPHFLQGDQTEQSEMHLSVRDRGPAGHRCDRMRRGVRVEQEQCELRKLEAGLLKRSPTLHATCT